MNGIKWVAQFNAKDDVEREIIKIGVKQERHLYFACFDFDTEGHEVVASTEDELKSKIRKMWGSASTFSWIESE